MLTAFNKPYGVLSQFTPEHPGQRTLAEFGFPKNVYPIGRLDADSEGLLLLSDETDLNERLLHPRHAHEREYWVQVERIPTPEALQKLSRGVLIQGRKTLPGRAWLLDPQPEVTTKISSLSSREERVGREPERGVIQKASPQPSPPSDEEREENGAHPSSVAELRRVDGVTRPTLPPRDPPVRFRKTVPTCWIGLELIEGKNRQVRRMTAAVGHPTLRLLRMRIGKLSLGHLQLGGWKELSGMERSLAIA